MVSISSYDIVPTVIFGINIAVGVLILPFPVALLMLSISLLYTNFIFPYPNLSALTTSWGSPKYFLLMLVFLIATIRSIFIGKTYKVLFRKKIKHIQELSRYKRVEALDINLYQQEFDRVTKSELYGEDVLFAITHDLQGVISDKLPEKEKKIMLHAIDRLEGYRDFVTERLYIERHHLPLHPHKRVDSLKLVDQVIDTFEQDGIQLQLAIYNHAQTTTITCDINKVKAVIHYTMHLIQTVIK